MGKKLGKFNTIYSIHYLTRFVNIRTDWELWYALPIMAVLAYNEITLKKVIVHEDEPWIVQESHVFRKQKRKPVNVTKLKNLISGRSVEVTFHQNETADEADIETKQITYLYESRGAYWFCDVKDKANRFELSSDTVGTQIKFVPANTELEAVVYDDVIIGVKIPIKMELRVKESAPAVRGNTSSGATKEAILETGAKIQVPLFINEGDLIRVHTEDEQYAERVEKA